jgi:hypothetical protein
MSTAADVDERLRRRREWIDSFAIRPAPEHRSPVGPADPVPQPMPWDSVLAQLGLGPQRQPVPATPQRAPDPLEGQRGGHGGDGSEHGPAQQILPNRVAS